MGRENLELRSPLNRQATDERLKLWAAFLRLSPSYEIARQEANGLIDANKAKALVKDFDLVKAVYRDFGDVWSVTQEQLWQQKSFHLFGVHLAELNLKVVHVMQAGQAIDRYELDNAMRTYVEHTRVEMVNPLTALVSVPIDMNRADLINLFNGMITYFKENREDYLNEDVPEPKYKISGEKKHLKVLQESIAVVEYKALNPNMQLWRVGQDMNVNRHYADKLKKPEGLIAAEIFDAKNTLTSTVGRILRQALLVSENAARGLYPSYKTNFNHFKKFDYERIAGQLNN